MPTSPTLNNAEAQHQVYISRLSATYGNEIDPILEDLGRWIRKRINQEGNRIETRKKFDKLVIDIKKRTGRDLTKYTTSLTGNLDDLAGYEPQFQADLLNSVVVDFESEVPSSTQVVATATRQPMVVNGKAASMTAYIDSFSSRNTQQILSYVQSGFAQGQTTQQITSSILNDQLVATRRDAKQIARTTTNHMATQAKEVTFQENRDLIIGYQIVATLDSRTSDICLFQDGNIYYYNNEYNPMPPFHPNCRSTTSPVLSDKFDFLDKGATRASRGAEGGQQVSTKQTTYSWLKTQPAWFQDETLGVAKGNIFRNAGLSTNEFKVAVSDGLGNPLTLSQIASKDKQIRDYMLNNPDLAIYVN